MIEIVLKIYGINCENKWFGYFASGLTLSLFTTLIIVALLTEIAENQRNGIIIKLFLLMSILSKLFNYLIIKYKSTEIFEMNRKLRKFQNKSRISQLYIHIFSIFSILFSLLLAFISSKSYFCVKNIATIFEDLNQKIDSLPISSCYQISILSIHQYLLFISSQLLYIELKTRYISIIKEFRKEVINEKCEPDSDVLKLTQKFVLKFVNFKNGIKGSVDCLKYSISMDFVSTIAFIISCHVLVLKYECYHFGISRIVLMIAYYLWTMSSNLRIRKIENDLSLVLNEWLHLNPQESIRI
jgi:hypothetical protein